MSVGALTLLFIHPNPSQNPRDACHFLHFFDAGCSLNIQECNLI